jgi:hypothetical protein
MSYVKDKLVHEEHRDIYAKNEYAPPVEMTHQKVMSIALNCVMKDVTYVQKGGKVAFGSTKYSYMSEANLLEAARPAMVKHGLALMPSCEEIKVEGKMVFVRMSYTLTHVSGAVWPEKLSMWGSGMDSGDKAIYKAITGANKYMLFKLLNIPTGDDPESGKQPEEMIEKKPEEKPEEKTENKPYVMPDKEKVLKDIMKQFPSATEEDRTNRRAALNAELLGIHSDPVDSPDKVTNEQWAKIARGLKS